jgi:hypothetical protein
MVSSVSLALSLAPPITIPFMIFGGFFLNVNSITAYFSWLSYLSWFRYGNEALLINQWAGLPNGTIECSRETAVCPSSGHQILETFSFEEVIFFFNLQVVILTYIFFSSKFQNDFVWNIAALVGLIIFFRAISILLLKLRTRNKE